MSKVIPAVPPAAPSSDLLLIFISSVQVLSANVVLSDNDKDWTASGNYVPPIWKAIDEKKNPISHTKNQKVKLSVTLSATQMTGYTPDRLGELVGRGPGGMEFKHASYDFAPGKLMYPQEHVLSLESDVVLPDKIQRLNFAVDWQIKFTTAGKADKLGTTENEMFVTYGTPRPSSALHPDDDNLINRYNESLHGVTLKRMRQAVKLTSEAKDEKGAASIKPHDIVAYIHKKWGAYDLDIQYNNAWELADHTDGAQCQTIVRYIKNVIDMIGLDGDARVVVVWAKADKPNDPLENDYPTPNISDPNISYYEWKHEALPGESEATSNKIYARLIDHSGGVNLYEACLKFTHPKGSTNKVDTKYYCGGFAEARNSPSEVLHIFEKMSWVFYLGKDHYIKRNRYSYDKDTFLDW